MSKRRERMAVCQSRIHFKNLSPTDFRERYYTSSAKRKKNRKQIVADLRCDACGELLEGFSKASIDGKIAAKVHEGHPVTCSKKCKKALKRSLLEDGESNSK